MAGHFSPKLYEFLIDISLNNHKQWFEENKKRYESDVRGPALQFVRDFGARLPELSEHFVASDKKSGGSLMRIYRDVRFSKDKTPYKTNVGMHFRHEAGKDVHAPGYYVHMDPNENFLGIGMWRPDGPSIKAIRAKIDAEPDRWTKIISDKKLTAVWKQSGESLKRPPKGYAKDHPLIDELKRKDHILAKDITADDVIADDFLDRVISDFKAAHDYVAFLCEAIDRPF